MKLDKRSVSAARVGLEALLWRLTPMALDLTAAVLRPIMLSMERKAPRQRMGTTDGSSSISKRDEPPLRMGSPFAFSDQSRMPVSLLSLDF
jgi:hypothetical protein